MNQATMNKNHSHFDEFKFNKYMAMYPFNDAQALDQWLTLNDLTQARFLQWFERDGSADTDQETCPWMDYSSQVYQPADDVANRYTNPFGVLIDFMLEKATADLQAQLRLANDHRMVDAGILLQAFRSDLQAALINMIAPTLTLELNVARVSGWLTGEQAEDRYNSYIELLKDAGYRKRLFAEYPVLLDRLINRIGQATAEILEFHGRLCRDHHTLTKTFGPLGEFKGFLPQRGDSHHQGRFVRLCQFAHQVVVYKPRSLRVDVAYQNLLKDLNHAAGVDFKTHQSLDQDAYGWCQFIQGKDCQTAQEQRQYYINLGHHIMLMYVLNSSDFHFENMIQVAQHPVPVDLETLMHASVSGGAQQNTHTDQHTVLDSMILPQKIKFPHHDRAVDYSVLGHDNNREANDSIGVVGEVLRDDMSFISPGQQATSNESGQSPEPPFGIQDDEIARLLSQGFEQLYRFFMQHKGWLSANQHFITLTQSSHRFIARSTNTYVSLIRSSFHPDYLRQAVDLKLYLHQRLWQEAVNYAHTNEIIKHEVEDLIGNDVPVFHITPESTTLLHNGQPLIEDHMDCLKQTIEVISQKLSEADLQRQLWLIHASMNTRNSTLENRGFSHQFVRPGGTLTEDFIRSSTKKLLSIAPDSANRLSWKNHHYLGGDQCTLADLCNHELFNGQLGCLLYLYYQATLYQDAQVLARAELSLQDIIATNDFTQVTQTGGYVGLGGVLYFFTKVHQLTGNPALIPLINNVVNTLKSRVANDTELDVLAGSAGAILALLHAHQALCDPRMLAVATACGDHLISHHRTMQQGAGWVSQHSEDLALGGFSHGVSGIGYALAKLAAASGQKRFRTLALQAIAYEDSLFDKVRGNYRDLRTCGIDCQSGSDLAAWCNGMVGIAMSRLDMLNNNTLPELNEQFQRELPGHISKVITQGLGHNHSLCHGDASCLEYLFMVAQNHPHLFSQQAFAELLSDTLTKIDQGRQKNGVAFDVFSPGLMLGSLGLPLQCMRFEHPGLVGNICLLN